MAYTMHFDGGSRGNPGIAGAGWVIHDPQGNPFDAGTCYVGNNHTNNVSEYTGLIKGMEAAFEQNIKMLMVYGDSKLAISQVTGKWKVHKDTLKPLCESAKKLYKQFDLCHLEHVPRAKNKIADALSNIAMDDKYSDHGLHLLDKLSGKRKRDDEEALFNDEKKKPKS